MTELIKIDYTNYEGKRAWRIVWPISIGFKSTLWHPEPQWIMYARDVQRRVYRDFALLSIHKIEKLTAEELAGIDESAYV